MRLSNFRVITQFTPAQYNHSSTCSRHSSGTARPLTMGPISCPEASVNTYQRTLPNNPEERRPVNSHITYHIRRCMRLNSWRSHSIRLAFNSCVVRIPEETPAMGTGALSLKVKRLGREPDYSHANEWSYTSTTPYAFIARCLIRQTGSFVFFFNRHTQFKRFPNAKQRLAANLGRALPSRNTDLSRGCLLH